MLKMDRGVKIVKTVKRVDKEGEVIVHNCGVYLDTELNLEQANKLIEEWNRNPEPNCTYSVEEVRVKRDIQIKIDG